MGILRWGKMDICPPPWKLGLRAKYV